MSLELQLVLSRILVPALFAMFGGFLLTQSLDSSEVDAPPARSSRVRWGALLGVLVCALGLIVSEYWSRGILFRPSHWLTWTARYQWQWLTWGFPVSFLILGATRIGCRRASSQAFVLWPQLFLLSMASLYIALAEFDTWGDRWQLVFYSLLIGLIACIVNVSTLHELAASGASRWVPLVVLGQLGCSAAVALQSYASLGEWILSFAGLTIGLTVVSLIMNPRAIQFGEWSLSILLYPASIAAVVGLLLTPFFQSKPLLPTWLFGMLLFLPALVWFFDIVYGRYGRVWWRVLLAALVCAILLGTLLAMTNPFQSEW